MPSWKTWLVLVVVVVATGLGLYLFENRGLPREGWQLFLGEGPEPTGPLDRDAGFPVDLNVTPGDVEGRAVAYGRYVGTLPPDADYELVFRSNAPNVTLEVEIGDAKNPDCRLNETASASGDLSAGRYALDSQPGLCRVSVRLDAELADDTDGAPLEWEADLHHAGTEWWFSFEASDGRPAEA